MSRNQELVKNTFIIAIGRICTQFVSFFLLPVYTHNLSTAEYGIIDMVVAYTSLIAPILSLQLERATFRFLIDARKDRDYQVEILSTAFSTIALLVLLTAILGPIIGITFNIDYWPYLVLILITSIISNVTFQIARGLGKNIHFSIGSIIVGLTNALTSIIAIAVFHQGIEWVFIGNIASHIAGFLYITVAMSLPQKISFSRRKRTTLKEMLRFSIPMIPNDISYWVINISDRTLIFALLSESADGIYAAATKIPSFIITFWNIFNMSWMETVSAHAHDKDAEEYISNTANTLVRLFASVCMGIIAFLPFVFNLLIGKNFSESYIYIPALVIGAFFNIIVGMLSSVYIGLKKTKEIAKTTFAAAILNLAINLSLIHVIGIWAAVISTVLSYAFVSFYRLHDLKKTVHIKLNPKTLTFIIVALIINSLLYLHNTFIINILNLLLTILIALCLNLNAIGTVIHKIRYLIYRKAPHETTPQKSHQ